VLNYYNETVPSVDEIEEAVPSITSNQDVSTSCQCSDTPTSSTVSTESNYIEDDELADCLSELEAEQQEMKREQEQRMNEYQQLQEQESEDWDALIEEIYNPKPFIYQTPGITIAVPHP
jgi:flagellar motility protein MotE (MotC chaperone)